MCNIQSDNMDNVGQDDDVHFDVVSDLSTDYLNCCVLVVYDVYIISPTLDTETGQRFNNTPQIT